MTTRIYWSDLTFEKRDLLIRYLTQKYLEEAEEEGKKFLERKRYKGKVTKWQQAYVMEYAIDWELWNNDEDKEAFNWELAIKEYLTTKAEKDAQHKVEETILDFP